MLASWLSASTEERVPSWACQCAIQAISAAITSGSPVRFNVWPLFSLIALQFPIPGPTIGRRHSGGNCCQSRQIGSTSSTGRNRRSPRIGDLPA